MSNDQKIQAVGLVWYKPENYERIRSMLEDGDKLHKTYAEWLKAAENAQKILEDKVKRVIRVNLDPDEFAAWCKLKGIKLNATARNAYANEAAMRACIDESKP